MKLSRIIAGASKTVYAVFTDGSIHEVDMNGQKYNQVGSLVGTDGAEALTVSQAHVADGSILKSFLTDGPFADEEYCYYF